MSITTLTVAKEHLRVTEAAEDVTVQLYLNASERAAAKYLNRNVYADAGALAAAKAAAPAVLTAAVATYDAAILAAESIENEDQRRVLQDVAEADFSQAQGDFVRSMRGIVITDTITAAVLLTLGHLYANREENMAGVSLAALPMGVQALLTPDRIGMGV